MEDSLTIDADADQGTAVLVLDAEGAGEAADLLEFAELVYRGPYYDDDGYPFYEMELRVDPRLFKDYTTDVVDSIRRAVSTVTVGHSETVRTRSVLVIPRRVPDNWRELRRQAHLTGLANQAVGRPLPENHPVKHGLRFRSDSEVAVYDALLRKQGSLSETDTITVLPNCAARVHERTFEPDFIVIYGGRAGAIEVDGPHHGRRAAADHTRTNLLRDAGVRLVERIVVEDTTDPEELDHFVEKFLARLANQ